MKIRFNDLSKGIKFFLIVGCLGGAIFAFVAKMPPIQVKKEYLGTNISDTHYVAVYKEKEVEVPKSPQRYTTPDPIVISLKNGGTMEGKYSVIYSINGPNLSFKKNFLLYLSSTEGDNKDVKENLIKETITNYIQSVCMNKFTYKDMIQKNCYNRFCGSDSESSGSDEYKNLDNQLYNFGINIEHFTWTEMPILLQ